MGSVFYESTNKKAFFYEDRDIKFPDHLHKQIEIFYLLEGKVKISLNYESFVLHRGEILIIFPNMIHGYESLGPSRFYIGLAAPEILGSNGTVILKNSCLNPVKPITVFSPELLLCMEAMAGENKKGKRIERECRLYGYFNVMVDYLLEKMLLKSQVRGDDDILYPVLNYVLSHYKEEITLESAAHDLGISKCYLSRIFSGRLGYSFSEYLAMLRTEMAKELLETTCKGMDEIACLCGFRSESSFFRNFKHLTGTTPLQYRKKKT